jgi:hypothetical protein
MMVCMNRDRHGGGARTARRARGLFVLVVAVACSNGKGPSAASSTPDAGAGGDAGDEPDAGGCRRNLDCASGTQCMPPGEPQCGDGGATQECIDDDSCVSSSAGDLCEQSPCGVKLCVPRCTTETDCTAHGAGLSCELTSGRCVAKPCAQASDCPTNYLCSVDQACVVKPCLSDSDCEGFCVRSICSASPGVCR